MQHKPDITPARSKLGCEPKVKREAGSKRTIAYQGSCWKRATMRRP